VAKYLKESLKNLRNQTINDIEIICVDDGSTDESLKILEKYAEKDKRIKVIKQQHSGVSSARNKGLKAAVGKYIFFADPDDIVNVRLCEICYEVAEKTSSDIVIFDFMVFSETDYSKKIKQLDEISKKFKERDGKIFDIKDKFRIIEGIKLRDSVVWTKFYRKSFLDSENVKFKTNINWGEDIIFTSVTLALAKKAVYIRAIFYYYRLKRENSICTLIKTEEKLDTIQKIIREIVKEYNNRGIMEDHEIWLINKFIPACYRHLDAIKDPVKRSKYNKKLLKFFLKRMFI
jgi:glycosyltransferase involved in cell wall biosynthesis